MQSMEWYRKRQQAMDRAGNKCEECGSTWKLEVHHNDYAHIGNERPEDLKVLCWHHHKLAHVGKIVGAISGIQTN
jgi:hypothetical protein